MKRGAANILVNNLTHKVLCYVTNIFWTTKLVVEDVISRNSFELESRYIYKLIDSNKLEEAEMRLANLAEIVGKYNHTIFKLNSQVRYKRILCD